MAKTKSKSNSAKPASIPRKIVLILNIVAALLLGLSYLAAYVAPDRSWILAFLGFLYPAFLLLNLFFILFWLVFLKKYFLISLLTIALGYSQLLSSFQLGLRRNTKENGSFTIMSYNVRQFDVYNWRNTRTHIARNGMFNLIYTENPDILCLQDYYQGDQEKSNFTDTIASTHGLKYHFVSLITKGNKTSNFGLATFSKHPIVHSERVDFPNTIADYCLITDIVIHEDTIRVLNTHLKSVHFGKEDYQFVSEITNNNIPNSKMAGFKTIFSKLKKAFQLRSPQVKILKSLISQSPHPIVLCGDFNDTPSSYAYHQITQKLDDAFVKAGKGFGKTYTEFIAPIRIDYIFLNKNMAVDYFKVISKAYSDHYPVVAKVRY